MISHPRRYRWRLCAVVATIGLVCPGAQAEFPNFEYHKIAEIGARMGQTSLVDIDKDGDLDWVTGCNGGDIWWFEHKTADNWIRHSLGKNAPTDVGGTAFDIDGDGWIDQLSGGAWYRNTGKPRAEEFVKYPNGVISGCHDNVAADIDGDKKLDVVVMSDKSALFWPQSLRLHRWLFNAICNTNRYGCPNLLRLVI